MLARYGYGTIRFAFTSVGFVMAPAWKITIRTGPVFTCAYIRYTSVFNVYLSFGVHFSISTDFTSFSFS